jgi:predicted peptidase
MTSAESASCDAFVARECTQGTRRVRYRLHAPPATIRPRAVLLFLHGSGECGNDNLAQTRVGLGPALLRGVVPFPLLTVFPQLPAGALWQDEHATAALAAVDDACAHAAGDPDRIALTGLSRGGYGVWQLALTHPGRFRALIPVCAGITAPPAHPDLRVAALDGNDEPWREAARRLRTLPVWMVHGARDTVIPVAQSRRMAAALREAGAAVHYRELPEANHNAWDAAYDDAALWRWLGTILAGDSR